MNLPRRVALLGVTLALLAANRHAVAQDPDSRIPLADVAEVMAAREAATFPIAFTYEAETRFDSAPVDPEYRWQGRIVTNGRALLEQQRYKNDVDPSPSAKTLRDTVEVRYFDGSRSLVVKRDASDEGGWLGSVQSNLPGTGRMSLLRLGLFLDLAVPTPVSTLVRRSTTRHAALPPGSPPGAIYVIADLGEPRTSAIEHPVGFLLDADRGYFPVRIVMYAGNSISVGAPDQLVTGADALSVWCTYSVEEVSEISPGIYFPARGTMQSSTTTVHLRLQGPIALGDTALSELKLPTEVKRATVRNLDTNRHEIVGTAVAEPDLKAINQIVDQVKGKLPTTPSDLRVQPNHRVSSWIWASAATAGVILGAYLVLRTKRS